MDAKKVRSCSRDAINSLPDEVLAKILTFLPTKRAASTSLVSKRWRNLFPLMFQLFESQHDVYLDYSDLVYPEKKGKRERKDVEESFGDFVDKTLSSCNSIKKLSLKCPRSSAYTEIDQWVRHALERGGGVVDLVLCFSLGFARSQSRWPTSAFKIKTLVKLTIEIELGGSSRNRSKITFSWPKVFLPVLKSLSLRTACVTCEILCYSMLPGCPILEELTLQHLSEPPADYNLRSVGFSLSHKTLKRLTSHYNNSLENCRIMCFYTPSLVYLDYSGLAPCSHSAATFLDSLVEAKLEVFFDPNLQHDVYMRQMYGASTDLSTTMNWMRNVKILSLSSASVKGIMYSTCVELPFFPNLVKLHFESDLKKGWQVLQRMLNKSPKLETLVLKGLHCVSSRRSVLLNDRNEVKVLEIYGFRGRGREVRQVKCFLQLMQFLQVMKVEIDADDNKKLLLMNRLLALPKPSLSKLQILFL